MVLPSWLMPSASKYLEWAAILGPSDYKACLRMAKPHSIRLQAPPLGGQSPQVACHRFATACHERHASGSCGIHQQVLLMGDQFPGTTCRPFTSTCGG